METADRSIEEWLAEWETEELAELEAEQDLAEELWRIMGVQYE